MTERPLVQRHQSGSDTAGQSPTGHSDSKTLAIIQDPHFGVGDRGEVALWFQTYVTESGAALQVFDAETGIKILKEYGVRDAAELAGKPCWVDCSTVGMIHWVGAWKK